MKIKYVIMFFSLMLLSGCTVNYNLTISGNNVFDEELVIKTEDNDSLGNDVLDEYNKEYPVHNDEEFRYYNPYTRVDGVKYYNKEYEKTSNGYIFTYKTNYGTYEIQNSRTIYTAFKNFRSGYNSKEKYYYLYTDYYLYNSLASVDNLTVNITLNDSDVVYNNANRVNDNTYTWNIDKDHNMIVLNYIPKNINSSEIDSQNDEEDETKEFVNDNKGLVYTIAIVGIGVFIIAAVVFTSKFKFF